MSAKTSGKPGRRAAAQAQPSTRSALLTAARRLFARDGYQAVSVRQLAQEANVNPAMVKYHFRNKEGLYLAVIQETVSPILQQFAALVADGPLDREALAGLLRSYMALLQREAWLPPLVTREVLLRDGPLRTAFTNQIARRVVSGLKGAVADAPATRRSGADLTALSVLAMVLFPFIGRPVVKSALGITLDEQYAEQMAEHIAALIFAQAGKEEST
ncbi:TetR/AcrR family transcriptional regulator [Sedimenticola hydrogenitrophicus]|uniref:TetR/AcrR family transcriptional regulator n=1 Tax=Sedimenticola hydrogenitrophicus TaxID=2967975 RepID=UPI0021A2AEEB|nr:TetR/AcrR family transcriptional regulator [Sedimenticola hydrogenitrophicus]